MEDDALNVLANEREANFDIVEEQRIASERKARRLRARTTWDERRSYVSRPSLVIWKSSQGIRAATKEPLWQRNRLLFAQTGGRRKRADDAELGLSGQNDRFG